MTATSQKEHAFLQRTATGEAAERAALYKELSHADLLSLLFSRDAEIENIKKTRRYGLVWEDKPEEFDINTVGKIPVLSHVPSLGVVSSPNAQDHVLIKGDNYHALKALTFTHEGAVDVIYIDPPYNTGHKDFKYNDKFVDREDGYRHSKWLSFMAKRLRLAKQLLKDSGVVFLSIDDNEVAQLKLLCDDIFGSDNWIVTAPVITNLKGNNDQFGFAGTHEYLLGYAKSKPKATISELSLDDDECEEWLVDERGAYKLGANLKASGQNAPREKRKNLFFPLYVAPDLSFSTTRVSPEQEEVWPITDGKDLSWRWQRSKFERDWFDVVVRGAPGSYAVYKKQRPSLGELPSKKAKSVMYSAAYSTSTATAELKDLFGGERIFASPKATKLIRDVLELSCPRDGLVVDFFAGSGTTGHAVMQLNAEDGEAGKRRCILVTNNEGEFKDAEGSLLPGGICTNVTYPRLRKVIEGYSTPKGKEVAGLAANLHFYETKFVEEKATRSGRQALMAETVDMLNLKEGCFTAVKSSDKRWKTFTNGSRHLVVLFDGMAGEECAAAIENLKGDVAVYAFSFYEDDDIADDFEHLPNVRVRTMPDALLKAYRRLTLNKTIQ